MVIVLEQNISEADKQQLRSFLERNKFRVNEIAGEESTIFGAVGRLSIDPREVEILPGVERVIPISKPYKMASREFKKENTVAEIPNNRGQIIRIGGARVIAIAGPCAVENRDQMMNVARCVAESGAVMLRGGAYKPRTSPYSFQGLGEEGLKLLKEAGDAFGLPVVTECVSAEHLPAMEKYVDVYQIGARNMQNFELLKKVGALGKPVILKRGLSATIEEWLMAAEYLLSSGTDDVILCERGIRTYERATRNTLDLSAIPIIRGLTHLPVIVDPSHAVGIRDKVPPMALAAIAAGSDGIIVEVHCNPDKALSDGAQSLYPEQFDRLMRDIEVLAPVVGREVARIRSGGNGAAVCSVPADSAENKKDAARKKCAYSGSRGAYAEIAVSHYFDGDANALPCANFRDVFQSVVSGKAEYGMIPVENSLAGSVYENYDNLLRFEDIRIAGALKLRIAHALLGVSGTSLDSVKAVYSHPQGLAQCSSFLSGHPEWEQIECTSTSAAAAAVFQKSSAENVAIASEKAAAVSGLSVLKTGIEDDPRNYTRFIVITATNTAPSAAKKTSSHDTCPADANANMATVAFATKNNPGALYECLGIFQHLSLNLTRLESRPIHGQPWRYMFYADVELSSASRDIYKAISLLKQIADDVRLLGVYREIN
ncbi:MAG: 3-deoxy-7-phosphoheptulonate synthase [Bacteroides sp.]|nr:3-deoxy-7-phosphoheptulonate synthase [Prevotella sp.]MCM1408381.1 3-deoxy-7-phosphoheptulonate synthase [Treponema brennaborense]MCM1470388.1 3-deoxy-7-phosphoheptulonate synthase [Bacteroides sp.]